MNKMKKLMIAMLSMFFALSGFAQNEMNPEERAKKMTDKMKTALNLTDEQFKAVEMINEDFIIQRHELNKSTHDATITLKDKYEKELSAVLTEEQMEKAKELRKERKRKMHKKGKPVK